jgi:hypothetical protein
MENEMSEEPRQKWGCLSAEFRQRALEQMKTCKSVKVPAKELGGSAAAVVSVEATSVGAKQGG